MLLPASRVTEVTLDSVNSTTFLSGQVVTIMGFIVSSTAAQEITISTADAAGDVLFHFRTVANESRPVPFFWKADRGLKFSSASGTTRIALFHSQPGS